MDEPYRLTYGDLLPYIIAGNVLFGVLFGMFPLIAGLRTGDRRYAVFGFLGAVVGGAILGIILSFPIALVFEWLILGKRLGQDKDMQAHSEESTLV